MNTNDVLDALSTGLLDFPDLVFAFTPGGKYLFANRMGAEFLGYERDEIIGYHWTELGLPEQVMEPFTSKIAEVATNDAPGRYRLEGSPERGSRIFDIALAPIHGDDAGVMGVLVIAHDVTRFGRPG